MKTRLLRLRGLLESIDIDALVVSKIENVRYLSGFSGSSAVAVVTPDSSTLITDGRYREQAAAESPHWETVIHAGELSEAVADALTGAKAAGFEVSASFDFHRKLAGAVTHGTALEPTEQLVEGLRCFKDESEIESIRAATECARAAFAQVLPLVKQGTPERQLAAELDYRMMLAGAESPAFDTVVASGPNSSLPHAGVTDRVLAAGDLVVMDFGACRNGYNADITRTVPVGEPDTRARRALEAVKGASRAAIEALEPGCPASEIYQVAHRHLEERGLSEYFTHGLGHGVGLEVHEKPAISARSNDTLDPGMVFTIEPGVYIAGWGGVRFEEMVLMTGAGAEVLTADMD